MSLMLIIFIRLLFNSADGLLDHVELAMERLDEVDDELHSAKKNEMEVQLNFQPLIDIGEDISNRYKLLTAGNLYFGDKIDVDPDDNSPDFDPNSPENRAIQIEIKSRLNTDIRSTKILLNEAWKQQNLISFREILGEYLQTAQLNEFIRIVVSSNNSGIRSISFQDALFLSTREDGRSRNIGITFVSND
jgi:hypothetical protein